MTGEIEKRTTALGFDRNRTTQHPNIKQTLYHSQITRCERLTKKNIYKQQIGKQFIAPSIILVISVFLYKIYVFLYKKDAKPLKKREDKWRWKFCQKRPWCTRPGSNPWPVGLETGALPFGLDGTTHKRGGDGDMCEFYIHIHMSVNLCFFI